MSISNHKKWRQLVTGLKVSFGCYSSVGVINELNNLKQAYGEERAFGIVKLIGSVLRDKNNGIDNERLLVMSIQSPELRAAVRRNSYRALSRELSS